MAVLLFICFNWQRFNRPKPYFFMAVTIFLMTFAIWCHGRWYLPFIIVLGLALARKWRSVKLLSVCIVLMLNLSAIVLRARISKKLKG